MDTPGGAHTSILVGELAKLLKQSGVEIGQHRLFQYLRENGYLINRRGSDYSMPTQYVTEVKEALPRRYTCPEVARSYSVSVRRVNR